MTDAMERRIEAQLREWAQAPLPVAEIERHGARARSRVRVVERALERVARRRARRVKVRRWSVPLASAAGILGIVLTGAMWYERFTADADPASQQPALAETNGEVRVVEGGVVARRNGVARLLRDGARLRIGPGDVLSTPADGRAEVGLDEGARIQLGAATELVVPRAPGAERFSLKSGRASIDVPPNADRARAFVVQTPNVEVAVRGTQFVVDVRRAISSTGWSTSVAVSRGTVWILRGNERLAVLNAGGRWSSATQVGADGSSIGSGSTSAPLHDRVLEPSPVGSSSEAIVAPAPRSAAALVGVRQPEGRVGSFPTLSLRTDTAALADPKSPVGDTEDAPQTRSDQLTRENRQFQAALRARNSGNDGQVVAELNAFLRAYPDSVLAQEAQVERFRALKRLGRKREAEHAARQYLVEYDDGFARGEARDIALSPDAGAWD